MWFFLCVCLSAILRPTQKFVIQFDKSSLRHKFGTHDHLQMRVLKHGISIVTQPIPYTGSL